MAIPFEYNPIGGGGAQEPASDYTIRIQLDRYSTTADTGQPIVWTNISSDQYFTTYAGVPCLDCGNSAAFLRGGRVEDSNAVPTGANKARAYSGWFSMIYQTGVVQNQAGVGIGNFANYQAMWSPANYAGMYNIGMGGPGSFSYPGTALSPNRWYHVVQSIDADNNLSLYLDGQLLSSKTFALANTQPYFFFGHPAGYNSNYYYNFCGYLAGLRCYDRALTADEVLYLSREFDPHYTITASNLTCSFYQKNETFGITYSSPMTPTFEIIQGSLPSTISFDTSTGKFTGKGPTDADHVYNLKVQITAEKSDPKTVDVKINTYKTARISLSNQTFEFYSTSNLQKFISYTSDQNVTMAIQSGTLPDHVYFIADSKCFRGFAGSTAADTRQVVVRATSPNNQTGVAATMTLKMIMNQIVLAPQTFKFYAGDGAKTKAVLYSGSPNPVADPAWSLSGTLPTGVTFSDGVFSSDASQVSDQSATVVVGLSSQSGTSTAASAEMTVQALAGSNPIPSAIFYMPMTSMSDFEASDPTTTVQDFNISYPVTFTTQNGIACAYMHSDPRRCLKVNNVLNTWPLGGSPRTFSFWVKYQNTSYTASRNYFWYEYADGNPQNRGKSYTFFADRGTPYVVTYANSADQILSGSFAAAKISDQNWHHYAVTSYNNASDQLQTEVWLDGVLAYQARSDYALATGSFQNLASIGGYCQQSLWSQSINGYMASFRVYDRVLTDAEIAALAAEFTPTA